MDKEHLILLIAVLAVVLFVYDQLMRAPVALIVENGKDRGTSEHSSNIRGINKILNISFVTSNVSLDNLNITTDHSNSDTDQSNSNEVEDNQTSKTNDSLQDNQLEESPQVNRTINETIEPQKSPQTPTVHDTVTYYFFHASYCATCQAMLPMIRDVAKDHPTLQLELIDIHSGSPYIKKYEVSRTAISVIVRETDGVAVSGTKVGGYMDHRAIERFICTELDDEKCNNL